MKYSRPSPHAPMKPVKFIPHAEEKFKILSDHHFSVSREQVIQAVSHPDTISEGRKGRKIAQKEIDRDHVLRVV
jgi:hypothetical protein